MWRLKVAKDKGRRPKHFDRPGKRPGPPGPNGGSIIDQRGRQEELEAYRLYEETGDERLRTVM